MEQQMIDQEKKILEELETTSVFIMRPAIKNYIENNVQLYRQGINLQLKQLREQFNFL